MDKSAITYTKCRYYPLCEDIDTYCCDGENACYQYEPMPDVDIDKLLELADKLAMPYEVRTGLLMTESLGNVLCGQQIADSIHDYDVACCIRKACGVMCDD